MTKTSFLILVLLTSLFATCPTEVLAVQLEGVVLSETGPVTDAVVTAYPDYTSLSTQQNGFISTPGEKPGQYRISLPQGKYYLVARGSDHNTKLYGYHGLNPLSVSEEYRWIPLIALPRNKAQCEPGFQGIGATQPRQASDGAWVLSAAGNTS